MESNVISRKEQFFFFMDAVGEGLVIGGKLTHDKAKFAQESSTIAQHLLVKYHQSLEDIGAMYSKDDREALQDKHDQYLNLMLSKTRGLLAVKEPILNKTAFANKVSDLAKFSLVEYNKTVDDIEEMFKPTEVV